MRRLVLSVCAAAMACSPRAETPAPSAGDDRQPVPRETASLPVPESLVGEYRVAGIDGEPLDAPVGIAVSITEETISYEPRCLGYAWTYSYEAGTVSIARDPRFGPQRNADGSVTTCLPAVSPEYGQLARTLSAAEKVEHTPENGLRFSGGGRSVTLFSQ